MERESRVNQNPHPFLVLARYTKTRSKKDSMKEFIMSLKFKDRDLVGENELHEAFKEKRSKLQYDRHIDLKLVVLPDKEDEEKTGCFAGISAWFGKLKFPDAWTDYWQKICPSNHPLMFQMGLFCLITLGLLTMFVIATGQPFCKKYKLSALMGEQKFVRSVITQFVCYIVWVGFLKSAFYWNVSNRSIRTYAYIHRFSQKNFREYLLPAV